MTLHKQADQSYIELLQKRFIEIEPDGTHIAALITAWREFVESCVQGYQDEFAEFQSELELRDVIESLIIDQYLSEMPEHRYFVSAINQIDERYRDILIADPPQPLRHKSVWWWRSVPKIGGSSLYKCCLSQGFPIELAVRE